MTTAAEATAVRYLPARDVPRQRATDLGSVQVLKQGNLYLLSDPFGDVHPDSRGLGLYEGDTDNPFDRPWDIRDIVHGHDGYLDIALTMGIPAVCVAVYTFLVEPLRDYLRIPHLKENIYLGDFFLMVLLFTALNAFLESFFFRRADPVWLFFVTAVLGLRLVARIPIKRSNG